MPNAFTLPARFTRNEGRKLSPLAYVVLTLLCFGFFAPGFVSLPPTDRDESSFAQASKQMVETGNYVDIRLQEQPRYKKPIGIYWLQSGAVRLFNPQHLNEIWAYRVPSALGATIAVLMTAALGALLFSPEAGFVAALMLLSSLLLNVEARLAKTDAALLASIVTVMYGLAYAYRTKANPSRWCVPVLFWTAFAAGVLIKGPIILLPVLGTLLWLRVSDKSLAWFKTLRPLTGFLYALILIAPWFIAIMAQSHGAFMQQSAGNDMLAKLWQGQNRGIVPPGVHFMALPILFFPFSLFVLFALPDAWKNRKDEAVKFCLGWVIPTWVVFEVSFTKLPHYVLPVYPALALLAAKALLDGFPAVANAKRRLPTALIIGLWLLVGGGLGFVFAVLPALVDGVIKPVGYVAGGVLFLTQMAALIFLFKRPAFAIGSLLIGGFVFIAVTFGATVPGLQHAWLSRSITTAMETAKPCPQTQLIALGYHEPSLAFMAGTDTLMVNAPTEAAKALREKPCRMALVGAKFKDDFLAAFPDAKPQARAEIEGLNSGHGQAATLTLYTQTEAQP